MSLKIARINSYNSQLDKRTTMGRAAAGKQRELKSHMDQITKSTGQKNNK